MSGGFRLLLGWRDTARWKAFVFAIAIQIPGVLMLQHWFGLRVWIPDVAPVAIVLGGLLFGVAMGWSGGCPAGIWYKLGGGNISVLVSLFGLVLGYGAMEYGVFKGVRVWLQAVGSFPQMKGLTLSGMLGVSRVWLGVVIVFLLLFFLWRAKRSELSGGWGWEKTGVWIGVVGLLAWLSSSFAQRPYGMALLTGSDNVLGVLVLDKRGAFGWDLCFVLGVPLGGYLAAKRAGTFRWVGLGGVDAWKRLGGGIVLGLSASLAGGCTVGHGLTGIPLLSVGSVLFVFFAILGTWLAQALERPFSS